ncbi:uncharacterized protein DS421_18g610070 [Arachis hypogaea]|nr:uncharacterized protein DS421_18g610070 [Arachis hypogaea]
MNGSEGGWVLFPGRAGGEGHKIALPVRKRGKGCCHLSRPVSRGVENPDRLRESLALFSPSFCHSKDYLCLPFLGVYSTHSPVFRTAQVSVRVRLRMRTSFPSAHSPFTRFSKQRRLVGQLVPRALCPTHLSRSKCSSPVPPNAPISRQRSYTLVLADRWLRLLSPSTTCCCRRHIPYVTKSSLPRCGSAPPKETEDFIHPSSRVGAGRSFDQIPLKTVRAGLPACGSRHSRWPGPAFIRKSCSEIETARPRKLIRVGKSFHFRQMTRPPGSSTVRAPFPTYAMLPGTGLPRFAPAAFSPDGGDDHPGYALAPLTGTPGPANAHENPGRPFV